jgi:hypothetical protein
LNRIDPLLVDWLVVLSDRLGKPTFRPEPVHFPSARDPS